MPNPAFIVILEASVDQTPCRGSAPVAADDAELVSIRGGGGHCDLHFILLPRLRVHAALHLVRPELHAPRKISSASEYAEYALCIF